MMGYHGSDTAGFVMFAISCNLPLHNLYCIYLVLMEQIPDDIVFNVGGLTRTLWVFDFFTG